MNYRFMRIIVFFDLPVIEINDRREYTRFRKHLIKMGFIMMQESVYSKLALNTTAANAIIENIKKARPDKGIVQMITITEKQYSKMQFLVGEAQCDVVDTDERFIQL